MGLPYLYNQTFNYTVNIMINPNSIAFINMYPFIENPNMRDHISANTKNFFDSRSFIIIIYV